MSMAPATDLQDLLDFLLAHGGSDLHLSAGSAPRVRVHGRLRPLNTGVLEGPEIEAMLGQILPSEDLDLLREDLELDLAIAHGDARFRINAFRNLEGTSAVFRTIPSRVPSLDELGAPEIFKRLATLHRGLVLVTGPTGSGKSTTLAAILDHINRTQERHILTIEDPVEFVHSSHRSLINHREVGRSTRSFARALKSALREDPDVILVGEMRDQETISLALTAAETGHLVFGTLHTNSAPKTIDRIIDVFPAGDKEAVRAMISGSLEAVIAQQLLPRKEGNGRVAAYEILLGTDAVRNLIREGKTAQLRSMIQVGTRFGMQSMDDALRQLLRADLISGEEADRARAVAATEVEERREGSSAGSQPSPPRAPAEAPTASGARPVPSDTAAPAAPAAAASAPPPVRPREEKAPPPPIEDESGYSF